MKRWAFDVAIFLALCGTLGFVVVVTGIVPIKASSGHWAITEWFLNFSMERSVHTHTLGIEIPESFEQWQVLKGATQYDIGCFPCHGGPELRRPRIAQGMTPTPPLLPQVLHIWQPGELYYIVKHGVKLTGMPAWPALQRDDEVWAMVAFLRKLPGLDEEQYAQLVRGAALTEEALPHSVVSNCARCHGVDGMGRGAGAFPKIGGQKVEYLRASLEAFAAQQRHSGVMGPQAAALGREAIQEVASYYSSLPRLAVAEASKSDPIIALGAEIATQGIAARHIPPCAACHGPNPARRNPVYPELAGQYPEYLALQLALFQKQQRGGTAYSHIMQKVAAQMTPEQMKAAALYFASLPLP